MKIWLMLVTLVWCAIVSAQPPTSADIVVERNLVYRTVEGQPLALDVFRPAGPVTPRLTVLAMHGGAWVTGERAELRPFAELLAGWGAVVVSIDYRLAPRWLYPAPLEDARAAVAWMRTHAGEYGFDFTRLYVAGASAGAQIAGLLVMKPDPAPLAVKGTILMATPSDLTVPLNNPAVSYVLTCYLGAAQDAAPARYAEASLVTYAAADLPPFLILHGADDAYVPPDQSKRLADALRAKKVPVTLVLLPKVGHELPTSTSAAGDQVRRALWTFLEPALKPPAPPAPLPAAP